MPEQRQESFAETRDAGVSRQQSFPLPNGQIVELSQLGLTEYKRVEQEALAEHKRNYIRTYTENADLLPKTMRVEVMREAMADAARMKLEDLPEHELKIPRQKDGQFVFDDNGEVLTTTRMVPYTAWWMSETLQGKTLAVWLSMRKVPSQSSWTLEKASEILTTAMAEAGETVLEDAAQVVGELSESRLADAAGNLPTPAV